MCPGIDPTGGTGDTGPAPAAVGARQTQSEAREHQGAPYYLVGASWYDDPTSHAGGSCGTLHSGRLAYAELSNPVGSDDANAMGKLPCGTPLRISYNGKVVIAYKADTGNGGGSVNGHYRCIDLFSNTAKALGFTGVDTVAIQRVDGKPIGGSVGNQITTGKDPFSAAADAVGSTVSGAAGDVSGAVSGTVGALGDIAKAVGFIFSLQFLYVIGGGILVLFAIYMILKSSGTAQSAASGVKDTVAKAAMLAE